MKLFYMNAYGSNFGDAFGIEIVRRMFGRELRTCDLWPRRRLGRSRRGGSLDIRAVRGPLTRAYVQEKWGLTAPSIYGDPALLAKSLFPNERWNPVRRFGVIPHHHDIYTTRGANVMLPSQHWRVVLDFILGCELVISSSLHGIVVAEAFGIPSRWLRSSNLPSTKTENVFKYNDYYASTDRSLNDWSETVQAAVAAGGKEPITNFDPEPLRNAFPCEMLETTSPLRELVDRTTDYVSREPW